MYHIAICDDEIRELDKTQRMVKTWLGSHKDYDFKIDRFENAKELLDAIEDTAVSYTHLTLPTIVGV